jgi:AGZA family xanthine/uracil permease-like MFS transporter
LAISHQANLRRAAGGRKDARVPSLLDRLFRLPDRGARLRTEVLGGATTFVTMAYIIVVNPAILEAAGLPRGPSTLATILAAVFGSLLMGLYANRPIAVAPYMGENAFLAYSLGPLIAWPLLLGAVFVSGAAFLVLTLLGLRVWLANAISPSLKHSFAVGIGLFLLFIGLYQTRIVVSGVTGQAPAAVPVAADKLDVPASIPPLQIGNLHQPEVLLAVAGFVLMMVLLCWRVPGGILLGIAATALAGYALELRALPRAVVQLPWDSDYDLSEIAGRLDIPGILHLRYFPVLLTLFLMSFLDTLGTLVAVGSAGGLLDEQGNFPEMQRPMLVDSVACMFSAAVGTSTSGAYIESATGIQQGARTGLAAVVVALLFGLSIFFLPLAAALQQMPYAYGPALMAVGVLMMAAVVRIDFTDLTEAVPAVVTITLMLFTFNIANGLTAGLVFYPVYKLLSGRVRELRWGAVVLGGLCLVYFIAGVLH